MQLLLRLILAHIIADFFLQTDKINVGKNSTGQQRWLYLLVHSLIHAVVSYVVVAQWENWLIPLVIFATHYVIDVIKISLKKSTIPLFVTDQIAHIMVIVLIAFFACKRGVFENFFQLILHDTKVLACIVGYALMLKPTAIVMSLLLKRWDMTRFSSNGLPDAGKWIGFLERILILTFILTDHVEGVGFLLAAKSIFRFGDLNKTKDIKTTEYVLLGTLTSFSIAILTACVIKFI